MTTAHEIIATVLLSFHNITTPMTVRAVDAHGHTAACWPIPALGTITVPRDPKWVRFEETSGCDQPGAEIVLPR